MEKTPEIATFPSHIWDVDTERWLVVRGPRCSTSDFESEWIDFRCDCFPWMDIYICICIAYIYISLYIYDIYISHIYICHIYISYIYRYIYMPYIYIIYRYRYIYMPYIISYIYDIYKYIIYYIYKYHIYVDIYIYDIHIYIYVSYIYIYIIYIYISYINIIYKYIYHNIYIYKYHIYIYLCIQLWMNFKVPWTDFHAILNHKWLFNESPRDWHWLNPMGISFSKESPHGSSFRVIQWMDNSF